MPFTYIKHRAVANGFRNTNQPPNQMDFEKWPPYAEMETKGLRERERERELKKIRNMEHENLLNIIKRTKTEFNS